MPRSVAAFVFRQAPLEVLLLHRTPERGGFWQPVTGRVEADEAVEATVHCAFAQAREAGPCENRAVLVASVLREVEEETRIATAHRVIDLGLESKFTGYDGRVYDERAFAVEVPSGAQCTISDEHTQAKWVAPEEAMRLLYWDENREALRRLVRHVQG